jgi:hypothetical protein
VSARTAREPAPVVGQPLRRKEDARIITGQARWTDNLTVPGLLLDVERIAPCLPGATVDRHEGDEVAGRVSHGTAGSGSGWAAHH